MNARRGVVPLVVVVGAVALMAWSFTNGISAALDGGGAGSLGYLVIFIASAVLVVAGLVIAITNVVRGDSRVLALVTIGFALVAIIAVLVMVFWRPGA